MKILNGLLAAAYPFLIFAGLHWLEPRAVAALLGLTVLARAAGNKLYSSGFGAALEAGEGSHDRRFQIL